MNKLCLIIHTIIHLRPIQIRYQLWYRLRKMWRKASKSKYSLSIDKQGYPIQLQPCIEKPLSLIINSEAQYSTPWGAGGAEYTFTFLNISKKYEAYDIDWNDPGNGKLWVYNLNYMDYLLQSAMDLETGLQLIDNFIKNLSQNPTGLEAYPIALRGMNWIKFISGYKNFIQRTPRDTVANAVRPQIDSSLYAQYNILLHNLEYHLLANHILENGFSLLFGAFYFKDEKYYNKAKQILKNELNEQILDDGAHFELSPMYHQIILDRLHDCINLLQNNQRFGDQQQLLEFMQENAQKMLTWLNTITYSNGKIPHLNDSAPNIAPTTKELNNYARSLGFKQTNSQPATSNQQPVTGNFSTSGYRKFTTQSCECIIDIGQIGPVYQPGHAHADTFNFVLNINDKSVLVDSGISTYNSGETRLKERGTAAHNTVTVQDKNSSEVWSSFRVARRAKVKILKEDDKKVIAQHYGYKRIGTIHQREWNFSDEKIEITDTLTGKITAGKAHFWLPPHLNPNKSGQIIEVANTKISFEGADEIILMSEQIPTGYNKLSNNYKIEIIFKNHLKTTITCS